MPRRSLSASGPYSLQELVGRNCLGGGHDTSADGNAEFKKSFDKCKMQIIKTAAF